MADNSNQSSFLSTDTKITRQSNYLYVSDETTEHYTLNGIPVTSTITINSQITGDWLTMTKRLVAEDKKTLETISKTDVEGISCELSAQPVGQYMRISRKFRSWTADFTVPDNTEKAYMVRADGSILTLKDLFVAGYDYETAIKKVLAEFLKTDYFPDEKGIPSIDEAYKSLNLTLYYQWFSLYNIEPMPSILLERQIDLSFDVDDFKGFINPEALLK